LDREIPRFFHDHLMDTGLRVPAPGEVTIVKPGVPWSVKGIDPEVRAAAKSAARRAGVTLGEWLNGVILDQNGNRIDSALGQTTYPEESFLSSIPQDPGATRSESAPAEDPPRRPAPSRRDDSSSRLQDIARQLADLAQKERQSAVRPVEPERGRAVREEEEFARVLERIDDNERQTVEALTAVNERLTMLGRQIAQNAALQPRVDAFARPEDVPGYTALESAIRNVVEHIEVSEKRTRDSLKAMQDRLSELAEQASRPPVQEEYQRTAPVLAQLEARVAELSNRLQRAESGLQAGMPEQLRREFGQIAERIETVKASADQMAKQAQTAAQGIARSELREIETRVLATLKEAQATAGPGSPDMGQIEGKIGGLSRRMDEIKANSATERDLHALRLAVEHLSSRVAQVPDVRPLAEMERRLAELGQRVEQAVRSPADPRAMEALEQNIAAVGERVTRTEEQLSHIETMEQAIRQLYRSLEQSREQASQAAEDAAGRTVERMLASGGSAPAGRSPELRALEEGLRAVRESAAGAERRNQETLSAVHETLSQIVEKIAEIESGSPASSMPTPPPRVFAPEPPAPPPPQPDLYEPPPAYAPEPETNASGAASLSTGDDFIAAARRAAQAAASRPSALRAEFGPVLPAAEEESGLLKRFHKRGKSDAADPAAPPPGARPGKDRAASARRRMLLLAGAVLLAAVSTFAFNMLVRKPAPPPPPSAIEAPLPQVPGGTQQQPERPPERQGRLFDLPSDPIVTGALPEPAGAETVRLPPPDTGTEALRNAAVSGNAAAQFIVATRYLEGDGVAQDPAKAAFWYEQAAASGLAPAQYRLGNLYERGKGVAQDAAQALTWYERAARQGNVKAMYNAAVILVGGHAGPADPGKAFALFGAAAERGLGDSQFNLAILHERGIGTKKDMAEAVFWYRLAALQGDEDAARRADVLAKSLGPRDLSKVEARLAAWSPRPAEDSANVVASLDPAWQGQGAQGLLSGAAVPPPADDLVAEAQHLLLALGFNVGTPDGKLGSRTVAALRQFQQQSGLEVTGKITPEVLDAMREQAG
jgi:localization factor PodJL